MSLKRKSLYTGLTKALNILLNFILQLIITPLILTGLGSGQFGIYTLINKMQGYLAMVDLRPSAILRYKLATLQKNDNIQIKKEYVGASILISLLILPIMILLGWLLSLGFQDFFNISDSDADLAAYAIIVISIFMGVKSFLGIPEAIIRGNNLEYKTFFVDPIRMILYGILVYTFLEKGFGLMGVISAIIIAALIDFGLKFILQSYYLPGYAPAIPSKLKIKEFLGSGSWYMGSSFFSQVLNSFDVIMIGALFGMTQVTIYALSRAILFRIAESISSITAGITSSIGQLIGTNRIDDLINIRRLLFRVNIIIGFMVMSYFIIFNNFFISLWVGHSNFVGEQINMVFCITSFMVLLSLADEIFINSLHAFKEKTKVVFLTSIIAIFFAYLLSFYLGLIAIPLGLMIAKVYQWLHYQNIINRHFSINVKEEIFNNSKIFVLLFLALFIKYTFHDILIATWFEFIIYSMLFVIVFVVICFVLILKDNEKDYIKKLINRKFNNG